MPTKTVKLEIRVSTTQRARYARAAAKAGLGLSTWARWQLDAAAAQVDDLPDARQLIDPDIDIDAALARLPPAAAEAMRERIRKLRRARWI